MSPRPTRQSRPPRQTFKVNVDFPLPLLQEIDAEAARVGIPRQSWIKLRLAEYFDQRQARHQPLDPPPISSTQ